MRNAAAVAVIVVAALHIAFLVVEMFLWKTPYGRKVFGTTKEVAESSAVLAANQGLYNGFLAAGLFWGLGFYGLEAGRNVITFFLACVAVAGLYGAATVDKKILLAQTAPAAIALTLLWAS